MKESGRKREKRNRRMGEQRRGLVADSNRHVVGRSRGDWLTGPGRVRGWSGRWWRVEGG